MLSLGKKTSKKIGTVSILTEAPKVAKKPGSEFYNIQHEIEDATPPPTLDKSKFIEPLYYFAAGIIIIFAGTLEASITAYFTWLGLAAIFAGIIRLSHALLYWLSAREKYIRHK